MSGWFFFPHDVMISSILLGADPGEGLLAGLQPPLDKFFQTSLSNLLTF